MSLIPNILRSFVILIVFTLLLGIAYPLILAGIGKLAFPKQANGSLIERNGIVIGSSLISQDFIQDKYFHGRPTNSDSSNAPLSKVMLDRISDRVKTFQVYNLQQGNPVPVNLITDSGSTLDPDISPEAAYYQIPRISRATGITADKLKTLIDSQTQDRFLMLYGQKRVNVLLLNLELNTLLHVKK